MPASRAIAWSWSAGGRGVVLAAPAAVVVFDDVPRGLAFAVGVLPAAIVALPPRRRSRWALALVGVLVGVPIVLGSAVADTPGLAVAAVFGGALLAVAVAQRRPRLGLVLLTLGLPMVGVGLSYTDVGEAAGLAALMVAGSAYAALVSMAWPERSAPTAPPGSPPAPSWTYGVQIGLAGATAAAIGFALDLDHVGWATAACLLVMRPALDVQRIRSVGRVVDVVIGALVAGLLANVTDRPAWYSVAIVVALALATATVGSRWYVVPVFTTFLAISLLIDADPGSAGARFDERVVETLLGVGLALLFGPVLGRLLTTRRGQESSTGRPAT